MERRRLLRGEEFGGREEEEKEGREGWRGGGE